MPILAVENLRKTYGAKTAVDGVGFTVGAGEIVGLLGPNGAGKTTTINMVLGMLAPDGGSVSIEGHDVARQRRQALERTNFAAVYASLPGNLTVRQNLRVFGMIYTVPNLTARIEALLDAFDLRRFAETRVGLLFVGGADARRPRQGAVEHAAPAAARRADRRRSTRPPRATSATACAGSRRTTERASCGRRTTCTRWSRYATACCSWPRGGSSWRATRIPCPPRTGAANLEDLFVRIAREPLSLRAAS